MNYYDNDVGFDTTNLLNKSYDHMKGKISSLAPKVRNFEHVWRISNYLVLECSATVICSKFNTLQRYLGRDSQHLLKSTMKKEKKKTDVEDLEPPVVGMRPCRICRDIEYMTITDGPRTSTFAFSKVFSKSKIGTLSPTELLQLALSVETNILDNFRIATI